MVLVGTFRDMARTASPVSTRAAALATQLGAAGYYEVCATDPALVTPVFCRAAKAALAAARAPPPSSTAPPPLLSPHLVLRSPGQGPLVDPAPLPASAAAAAATGSPAPGTSRSHQRKHRPQHSGSAASTDKSVPSAPAEGAAGPAEEPDASPRGPSTSTSTSTSTSSGNGGGEEDKTQGSGGKTAVGATNTTALHDLTQVRSWTLDRVLFRVWVYRRIGTGLSAAHWGESTEYYLLRVATKKDRCRLCFLTPKARSVFAVPVTPGTLLAVQDSTRFFVVHADVPLGIGFSTKEESTSFVVEFMKKMYEARNYMGRRRITQKTASAPAPVSQQPQQKQQPQPQQQQQQQSQRSAASTAGDEYNVYMSLEGRFVQAMHSSAAPGGAGRADGSTGLPQQQPQQPPQESKKFTAIFHKKQDLVVLQNSCTTVSQASLAASGGGTNPARPMLRATVSRLVLVDSATRSTLQPSSATPRDKALSSSSSSSSSSASSDTQQQQQQQQQQKGGAAGTEPAPAVSKRLAALKRIDDRYTAAVSRHVCKTVAAEEARRAALEEQCAALDREYQALTVAAVWRELQAGVRSRTRAPTGTCCAPRTGGSQGSSDSTASSDLSLSDADADADADGPETPAAPAAAASTPMAATALQFDAAVDAAQPPPLPAPRRTDDRAFVRIQQRKSRSFKSPSVLYRDDDAQLLASAPASPAAEAPAAIPSTSTTPAATTTTTATPPGGAARHRHHERHKGGSAHEHKHRRPRHGAPSLTAPLSPAASPAAGTLPLSTSATALCAASTCVCPLCRTSFLTPLERACRHGHACARCRRAHLVDGVFVCPLCREEAATAPPSPRPEQPHQHHT